jgi:hypothetical protein
MTSYLGKLKKIFNQKGWKHINGHCLAKRQYLDRQAADLNLLANVIIGHYSLSAGVYKCDYCEGFHITSNLAIE